MKHTTYIKLTRWQTFEYYSIVLLLLMVLAFALYEIIRIGIWDYEMIRKESSLIITAHSSLLLSILIVIYLRRKLRFIEIAVSGSDEEFQEALSRTRKEMNLGIRKNKNGYILAYWKESFFVSGIMITIIKEDNRISFNSIPDPDSRIAYIYFRKCRKIRQSFLINLRDVLRGIPENKKKEESEWSIKNILIRLGIYSIALVFVLLGLFMLTASRDWISQLVGLAMIAVPGFYFYMDQKIIFRENRKRKKRLKK